MDGLWDIPVIKNKITPQNYNLPRINPSLYKRKHNSKSIRPFRTQKIKHVHHHIPPDFKALNYLIEHSIWDEQINKQLIIDKKEF